MSNPLRILAVCGYPSDTKPAYEVFVPTFLQELGECGASVEVINPQSVWNLAKHGSARRLAPRFEIRDGIPISRPLYTSYSNIPVPFAGSTRILSDRSYARAAIRGFNQRDGSFDLCFGHFIYPHAFAALKIARRLGIPAVASLGESSFKRYERAYDPATIGSLLERFHGVYTNSPLLRDHCVDQFGLCADQVPVFPNGVSRDFYPRDREEARRQCGLPLDRPIVAFVGRLIESKGPLRLVEAIRLRPEIGAIFLGVGPHKPEGPQVLFQGSVRHEDVPVWLSAADVFALPTLAEGCSNAILEALSCGLPVISSDLPFNRAILDNETALLVDPRNTHDIGRAIAGLVDSTERRTQLSEAALEHAAQFSLRDRARLVLEFMEGCIA